MDWQKRMNLLTISINYRAVRFQNGIALIGLVNKYNAPKTIMNVKIEDQKITVQLNGDGKFKALLPKAPQSVLVNGISVTSFSFDKGIFTVETGSVNSFKNELEIIF